MFSLERGTGVAGFGAIPLGLAQFYLGLSHFFVGLSQFCAGLVALSYALVLLGPVPVGFAEYSLWSSVLILGLSQNFLGLSHFRLFGLHGVIFCLRCRYFGVVAIFFLFCPLCLTCFGLETISGLYLLI